MTNKTMVAVVLTSLVSATVFGEDVGPGARVRITTTTGQSPLIGTVVETDAGVLTVSPRRGEPLRLRFADVRRLEVSRRRS